MFNFRRRLPKTKFSKDSRRVFNGHWSCSKVLSSTISAPYRRFHQTVKSGVDATAMEHTACIGQPLAELIFQFVVVVSLANSELGGSPLNARAPPFPNFLQGGVPGIVCPIWCWTKTLLI